jgi:hypothetical protein
MSFAGGGRCSMALRLHVASGSVTGLLGSSGCGKMLREHTSGTLERLMSLPIAKADPLAGYGIAFGLLAAFQAVVVCVVGFLALGLAAPHGAWLVGLLAVGNAVLGMALGLFVSAFTRTEFQAVQFMPAIIFPNCCRADCSSSATRWPGRAVCGVLGAAAHLRPRRPGASGGSGDPRTRTPPLRGGSDYEERGPLILNVSDAREPRRAQTECRSTPARKERRRSVSDRHWQPRVA